MKKRAVSLLLTTLAVVSFVLPALAAAPPELEVEPVEGFIQEERVEVEEAPAIRLDGEPMQSVEYEILNGVCYVTVSSFVSMLDPEAMVEEENGIVTVNASTVVEVVDVAEGMEPAANVVEETLNMTAAVGAYCIVANDRYLYAEDGLVLLNGSVAAPVRVLAKAFNLTVDFDSVEQAVLLGHQEGAGAYLIPGAYYYDSDTLYWLSRIINAESGNQPLVGQLAVGNVVMNRVGNPRFPDTIYEVLFQKNQFTPASSGSINREPNGESIIAAKLVMDGAQVVPTALFFNRVGVPCYASRNRTYITTIGSHAFYA
ncbi:MAG: cell wall hydrolase [Oscillospiraceae bacterium]